MSAWRMIIWIALTVAGTTMPQVVAVPVPAEPAAPAPAGQAEHPTSDAPVSNTPVGTNSTPRPAPVCPVCPSIAAASALDAWFGGAARVVPAPSGICRSAHAPLVNWNTPPWFSLMPVAMPAAEPIDQGAAAAGARYAHAPPLR